MKNVIGYLRVSTDGQCGEERFGLDVQRQSIEQYCIEHDMKIMEWVSDEGESGAKERPGFDEIIYGDISNPPCEAVVVAKTDRVARDIEIYYYYKMMLRKKNIELYSVAEDFGSMGAFKPFLESFTLCVATMERDNITKRTSSGRRMKAKTGGYSGGRTPMGYHASNGGLVIDENEATIVRRVFELRNSGMTMRGICDKLNEEGYTTRGGKAFVISTVQSILRNERTYRGEYKYGDGEWVKGQHEPILK